MGAQMTLQAKQLRSTGAAILALALAACAEREAAPQTPSAPVEQPFILRAATVRDMKPAFGQIDSADAVPARARISGTLVELRVREGASVDRGEVIATISDARVPLQAQAEGAQASALAAELAQARADLARFESLHKEGFFPTQRLEQQRALVRALQDQVAAARAQRAVTVETGAQGAVLAPVSGKVLRVPVRRGGVVMMGEEVALVGARFVVRLRLPERNAAILREGAPVEVEAPGATRKPGVVRKIYPALADGRVEADIETEGLDGRVFGERVRVWAPAGVRSALVAPADYLVTRYGVDFARVRLADGTEQDVVVRRGEPVGAEGVANGVEILAGLSPGDALVRPLAQSEAR